MSILDTAADHGAWRRGPSADFGGLIQHRPNLVGADTDGRDPRRWGGVRPFTPSARESVRLRCATCQRQIGMSSAALFAVTRGVKAAPGRGPVSTPIAAMRFEVSALPCLAISYRITISSFGHHRPSADKGERSDAATDSDNRSILPMSGSEPTVAARRETISPLSDRTTGRLTYEVSVDASGAVFLSIVDKPLLVSVSPEPVPIARLQTLLAEPLATGEPFETRLLTRAFARRAKQNGLVLAAVLCHEGLLRPAVAVPKMHVCLGDWEDWAFVQRDRVAQQEELAVPVASGQQPRRAPISGDALVAQASGPRAPVVTQRDLDHASDTGAQCERNPTLSRLV